MYDFESTFRDIRPEWESSIEWDDQDRNVSRLMARADRLVDEAEEFDEALADIPIIDIQDAAVEYVMK